MKQKFENKQQFNDWVNKYLTDEPIVIEYGEIPEPNEYPCIMTYEFIDYTCIGEDEEEIYEKIKEQGYEDDEIKLLYYEFIYPSDF